MTQRQPCPPAPGPLEAYALAFDPLFEVLAQRRGFREYLQGLLLPRDRNKTLTALAGAQPIVQAQHPAVQRLQFFLSESTWDAEAVNTRRLELLFADPATRPHEGGVLVVDETGDRKDGTETAHVGRQYLGSVGKIDNGVVAVTSLWADEQVYYPLHVQPYTPAARLPKGKQDPTFRTKPQLGMALVDAALGLGIPFRAVVADCIYGESEHFAGALSVAELPYVVGLKPSKGSWAPADAAHTPQEAAEGLAWHGPADPRDWTPVIRRFRDGHEETWWAADLRLAGYGPDRPTRLVVATTDPATLPALTTWYLTTNLPRPGSPQVRDGLLAPAELAEVVRLYGLRNWVEQSYKQAKHELGWADFQVRSDLAIQRHWQLVSCAFSFCWQAWFAHESVEPALVPAAATALPVPPVTEPEPPDLPSDASAAGGKNRVGRSLSRRRAIRPAGQFVAGRAAPSPGLARPLDQALALVAGVVRSAPAPTTPGVTRRRRDGSSAQPLSPVLTKYR